MAHTGVAYSVLVGTWFTVNAPDTEACAGGDVNTIMIPG